MKLKYYLTLCVFALLISGCNMMPNTLTTLVQFQNASGLAENHKVMFNGTEIGTVNAVKASANGVEVTMSLDKQQAESVMQNAAAIAMPQNPPFVQIINGTGASEPIADGFEFHGLNNQLELAAWQGGALLSGLQSTLQDMMGSVQDYFESDEWQQTKENFQGQLEELGQKSKEAMDQVGGDFSELFRNLESHSAEAMKNAETKYQELEKQMQEFQEKGQGDLAETLKKMLENLNTALEKNKPQS